MQSKCNTNIEDQGNHVLTNIIELNSDDSNGSYTTTTSGEINVNTFEEEKAGIINILLSEEEQQKFSGRGKYINILCL